MDPASIHSRFLRGVDFIEEHLLEPVALADAAKQAGFSLHYFSRLFRVLCGSSIWRSIEGTTHRRRSRARSSTASA